jgi:hypothetical protein
MPPLNESFNLSSVGEIRGIHENPQSFLKSITRRPLNELVEMEDKLYKQHWRVRDAQLFGKKMPKEINPGVVYERRYGLSWVIGWGEDWDEVPTDT